MSEQPIPSIAARKETKKATQPQPHQNSVVDKIITMYPQETFISNCVYEFEVGKNRILQWNMVGSIAIRHEFQFTQIDVDFANKNFHRNLGITDEFGATLAQLNYSGMLLANSVLEQDEDSYEDD